MIWRLVLVRPHKHYTLVLVEPKQFYTLYSLINYFEIFSEVYDYRIVKIFSLFK
jgi:hypothetical protein